MFFYQEFKFYHKLKIEIIYVNFIFFNIRAIRFLNFKLKLESRKKLKIKL